MKAAIIASIVAATAASAQPVDFQYAGIVTSIQDDLDMFPDIEVGSDAGGNFSFDPGASGSNPTTPPVPGFSFFNFFNAQSVSAVTNGLTFEADMPGSFVIDNAINSTGAGPDVIDFVSLGGELPNADLNLPTGQVQVTFIGDQDWLNGPEQPNPETLGLENLYSAGVIIEFARLASDPFEGGSPTSPDDFVFLRSRIEIQLTSISGSDGTIATIGCRAAQLTAPFATANSQDLREFILSYMAGDARADFAPDGLIDKRDAFAFFESYAGCSQQPVPNANLFYERLLGGSGVLTPTRPGAPGVDRPIELPRKR